jgi:hypothetical protein
MVPRAIRLLVNTVALGATRLLVNTVALGASAMVLTARIAPGEPEPSGGNLSAVFPKPQFHDEHERLAFPMANDHVERPLGRAC